MSWWVREYVGGHTTPPVESGPFEVREEADVEAQRLRERGVTEDHIFVFNDGAEPAPKARPEHVRMARPEHVRMARDLLTLLVNRHDEEVWELLSGSKKLERLSGLGEDRTLAADERVLDDAATSLEMRGIEGFFRGPAFFPLLMMAMTKEGA